MKKSCLTLVLCFFSSMVLCQVTDRAACGGQEMRTSQSKPMFGKAAQDLADYFSNKIVWEADSQQRGMIQVRMNCKGQVYEATVMRGNLSEAQKHQITAAILEMPEWKPAEFDGPTDYLFYMDFLYRSNELVIHLEMR